MVINIDAKTDYFVLFGWILIFIGFFLGKFNSYSRVCPVMILIGMTMILMPAVYDFSGIFLSVFSDARETCIVLVFSGFLYGFMLIITWAYKLAKVNILSLWQFMYFMPLIKKLSR